MINFIEKWGYNFFYDINVCRIFIIDFNMGGDNFDCKYCSNKFY